MTLAYIKILGFMGDILAVREKIFRSIRSMKNRYFCIVILKFLLSFCSFSILVY